MAAASDGSTARLQAGWRRAASSVQHPAPTPHRSSFQGSRAAILDLGGTGGGYTLHLKGASYWKLQGFTVQSATKGIVLDVSNRNVIDGVHVTNIGDEGADFRAFSSDKLLTNSTVDNTGVYSPNYGEGVDIGECSVGLGDLQRRRARQFRPESDNQRYDR